MLVACLDLEGVLVPEIWIGVAERTGVDELRLTTRDIADYDELMPTACACSTSTASPCRRSRRSSPGLGPLPGAAEFLDWLRERFQVVILSDTFYQFAMPLMAQLGHPTLLCHRPGGRRRPHRRLHGCASRPEDQGGGGAPVAQPQVIATGDSYNDTGMLTQAEAGILFNPPANGRRRVPAVPGRPRLRPDAGGVRGSGGSRVG
jgi:phosphoserine/homoserine phosphotransferase